MRLRAGLATVLAFALLGTGVAQAGVAQAGVAQAGVAQAGVAQAGVAQAGVARIRARDTPAGSLVTNALGYVLFMFRRDGHGIARCERDPACLADWPLVTTTGRPVAGPGIDPKLLGTIPYRGKLREVTYAGWPLHRYRFSYTAQSSVLNIGVNQFGAPWYAIGASGAVVK